MVRGRVETQRERARTQKMRTLNSNPHRYTHEVWAFKAADLNTQIENYVSAFRLAPWFEENDPAEVREHFKRVLSYPEVAFMSAWHNRRLVGGGIGFAVRRKPEVCDLIDSAWHDGYYIDELFVIERAQRQGFCLRLLEEIGHTARRHGFSKFVVRTSVAQAAIQHIFLCKCGGQIEALQEVESPKNVDGEVVMKSDKRIIMVGELPCFERPYVPPKADDGCYR